MQPTPRDVSNKLSKEAADYRHYESCMTCGHFQQSGKCDLVDGNISPEAVCSSYSMKEKLPESKHAEFYQDEYKKVNA